MSSRQLGDWITSYLDFTKDTEPPKSYHTWVAISTIAAALQRRCFMRRGHSKIYPNLYIVLVGKSGGARKGTAMDIAKAIIDKVPAIIVGSDATSGSKLITKISKANDTYMFEPGKMMFQSAVTCISNELQVLLGVRDIQFLAQLTDLYDSHDSWTYDTHKHGEQVIQGACLNLLGGTAPDWIPSMFPQEAIGGGFTSRIIFVYEEIKGKTVSEEIYTEWHEELEKKLINDLGIITNLVGEYKIAPDTRKALNEWYEEEDEKMKRGQYPIDDKRFIGYCERRNTHVRKISMAMAASRSNRMVIELIDFQRALSIIKAVEKKMAKSFGGLGKSQYSECVEVVLDYMLVHRKASRSQVLRQFWRDIDSQTLKIVEEVLTTMKAIRVRIDPSTGEATYELLD